MNITSRLKNKKFLLTYAFYILAVLFIIVFSLFNPKFLATKNLVNILTQSSTTIILSIGMTLALITRGIDMSVGSILFVCAATMQVLNKSFGISMILMIIISILVGIICGFVNGLIVSSLNVYPLLPTLAMMYVYRGIGLIVSGGGSSTMPMMWSRLNSQKVFNFVPVHVLVALVLLVLFQFFLSNTKTGRHIFAIGDSEITAFAKGINVSAKKVLVYSFIGLLCGIAAIVSTAQTMSVPISLGQGQEFNAIIASVLGGASLSGGKGSVLPGALIGAIILSVISNILVILGASAYMYTVVYALVIFIVVFLDSFKRKT